MKQYLPPIKGIPREEQPIFTGYVKSYRPDSSSYDQLIGDVNSDAKYDTVLLPYVYSAVPLDGAKSIMTFKGKEGGTIGIDTFISDLIYPLYGAQGALGDFITESSNLIL